MDFNINNESFAKAYRCLSDANMLLESGLGNFNELDDSVLGLIGKSGINNNDILNNFNNECLGLKDKMYKTIESLASIDVGSANYFSDILGGGLTVNYDWDGTELTARMGFNGDGPSGTETWYDLNMSKVVKNMEKLYGYKDLEYGIREDGVKVLSGTTPDGEKFENLVIVAADVYHESSNPKGTFQRGQIVETSLGIGIVADYCGRSASNRKNNGSVHFDIATAWHTGEYMADAYGSNPTTIPTGGYEQIVPKSSVKSINSDMYNDLPVVPISDDEPIIGSEKDVNLVDGDDIDGVFNPDTDVPVVEVEDGGNDLNPVTNLSIDPASSNLKPKNNTLIAHRGYHPGGIWENSKDAFIAAGKNGFWGCEVDVIFDNDGNLVCSHNAVKSGENPPSFDEYLDICKEYGMTPVIDLKYENGTEVLDTDLSPAVLKALEDKGMVNTSVIQTNNTKDVAYIRENSEDARIWLLKDQISDNDMQLIQDNGVECVNVKSSSDKNMYRINNLKKNGVDVCIWNVQNENYKNALINNGATYVMSDYGFDVSPYQNGDVDYNSVDNKDYYNSRPVVSLSTDTSKIFDNSSEIVVETDTSIDDVNQTSPVVGLKDLEPSFDDSVDAVKSSTDVVNSIDAQLRNSNVNPNKSVVPLIYQSDYTNVNYGTGTLATHGCGIASLSMVASYYNDTDIMPDELAVKYRGYGSKSGTDHGIYEKTADELGLPFQEMVHYSNKDDLDKVVNALNEGCVVVAKAKADSVFTDRGHYIVLTGVSEDGKIYVNDPNKYNYNNKYLADGYENGFEQKEFMYGRVSDYFIYSPKSN